MNLQQLTSPWGGRPNYQNEYANWIGGFHWNYYITVADYLESRFGHHGKGASQEQGAAFEQLVSTYVYRLGDRVYGRAANRKIEYAAFLESKSKSGLPTAWHAHMLVSVPDEYKEKFEVESPRQWGKITRRCIDRNGVDVNVTGSFDIQLIYDLAGVASYCAKFAEDERAPILMNLPVAGTIVVETPSR